MTYTKLRVDPVAVDRFLSGDRSVHLRHGEKRAAADIAVQWGWTPSFLAARTGMTRVAADKALERARQRQRDYMQAGGVVSSVRTLPGSFSSRNGASQSRTGKDKRTRLEPSVNKADGQFGNVTPVSERALRHAIESCLCPWCGKGPFRMLPVHTAKAHGVDKWQFREMAGLSTNDPLCSSEARRAMSEHAKANPNSHWATAASRGRGSRKPQHWTRAGRSRTAQNLVEWERAHPAEALEQRRTASLRSITSKQGRGGTA